MALRSEYVVRGKLEANFSYLRPYLRIIILNMASCYAKTVVSIQTKKTASQLKGTPIGIKNASAHVNKLSCRTRSLVPVYVGSEKTRPMNLTYLLLVSQNIILFCRLLQRGCHG